MPLETATYIPDLVTSNPAASDGMNNADDHMRLIKGTLKATFPNFTAAALNSTQAQLDAAVAATANGVGVLADAGVAFKTNTGDGLQNPAAGQINLKLAGQLAASFTYSTAINTLHWMGPATFDGAVTAPGVVPIGGMIMWLTDTLPTVGSWCWANGGTLSRTGNGAALFALTGTAYGAGDGATTFNVINMQEVSPVGKSTMGGASSPGLLGSIASGVKAVLGALFGSDTHTLTLTELPGNITSSATQNINVSGAFPGNVPWTNGSIASDQSNSGVGLFSPYTSGGWTGFSSLNSSGTNTIAVTSNNTGGLAHSNLDPKRVVNFIIRIG